MIPAHIPNALTVHVTATGWDVILCLILPDRLIARRAWKRELRVLYANRAWPEKPVILVLPCGHAWRVYENGKVEKWQ